MTVTVSQALAALKSRNLPRALNALLTVWRAAPTTRLAGQLDTLSAWYLPTLRHSSIADGASAVAWTQLAQHGRATDVPILAETLGDGAEDDIIDRLQWLLAQPADPRWTTAVVALAVRGWHARTRTEGRIARLAFRVLHQLGDHRAVAQLKAADLRPRGYWGERAEASIAEVSSAMPPEDTAYDAADLSAALDVVLRTPPPTIKQLRPAPVRSHAQLLAMIHDAPGDRDARRVFADWLAQAGDPRAEFINLQFKSVQGGLSRRETRRQTQLLAAHGARWLGPLAPHVEAVDWHLGFPIAATVRFADRQQRHAALSAPDWRMLTALQTDQPGILRHPNLANVRQLGHAGDFMSPTRRPTPIPRSVLVADLPQAFETVVVRAAELPEMMPDDFMALHTLVVVHPHRSLGGNPLKRLGYHHARRVVLWNADPAWSRVFERLTHLDKLQICPPAGTLRFALTRRETGTHLDVVWLGKMRCRSLAPAIDMADRHGVSTVQIHTPLYAHAPEVLRVWTDAFAGAKMTLPRARALVA